ncbi:MAG: sigma-70 family RNA polymerase sigma factor [Clostridia bacterium]|nr:sigma-70 family RNA polymerase sigma factor [Clostridia bacterium]
MKKELTINEKKEILNTNIDIVYKFCHSNKSRYIYDFENFESFISECLVMAYEVIDYWQPEKGALSTFLFNTLQWKLLNKKNRDKKINYISLEGLYETPQEFDLIVESNEMYENHKTDEMALNFIEPLLNEESRLHYLEGKTFQEIAKIKGIAPSTAKNRVYKNIKEIKERVKNEYED